MIAVGLFLCPAKPNPLGLEELVAKGEMLSCTDKTSPHARMRTFFSLRATFRTFHPMDMHWLKMFERFCVSLLNHPIFAPCHSCS